MVWREIFGMILVSLRTVPFFQVAVSYLFNLEIYLRIMDQQIYFGCETFH